MNIAKTWMHDIRTFAMQKQSMEWLHICVGDLISFFHNLIKMRFHFRSIRKQGCGICKYLLTLLEHRCASDPYVIQQILNLCACAGDEMNILAATMQTMKTAVECLSITPNIVYVDGNRLPELSVPAEYVIHGDAASASIAAASILAKVSRDRFMYDMDKKYPEYDFAKHKGYGTKLHYEKLREYGPCEIHRMTFLKKMH